MSLITIDTSPSSFITGSQRYGEVHERSDIDLAVLVTKADHRHLNELTQDASRYADTSSIRFGKLNLILFTDPVRFEAWRRATEKLEVVAPVTRDEAIQAIAMEMKEAGL